MCREIPDARLVVLPGAAHLLALERPKELVGLIGGFLERVRGSVDENPVAFRSGHKKERESNDGLQ
jgi:hypothetical protein